MIESHVAHFRFIFLVFCGTAFAGEPPLSLDRIMLTRNLENAAVPEALEQLQNELVRFDRHLEFACQHEGGLDRLLSETLEPRISLAAGRSCAELMAGIRAVERMDWRYTNRTLLVSHHFYSPGSVSGLRVADSDAARATERFLRQEIVPEISFRETPLDEVISFLYPACCGRACETCIHPFVHGHHSNDIHRVTLSLRQASLYRAVQLIAWSARVPCRIGPEGHILFGEGDWPSLALGEPTKERFAALPVSQLSIDSTLGNALDFLNAVHPELRLESPVRDTRFICELYRPSVLDCLRVIARQTQLTVVEEAGKVSIRPRSQSEITRYELGQWRLEDAADGFSLLDVLYEIFGSGGAPHSFYLYPADDPTPVREATFHLPAGSTAAEILDVVCESLSASWMVDEAGAVHLVPPGRALAPAVVHVATTRQAAVTLEAITQFSHPQPLFMDGSVGDALAFLNQTSWRCCSRDPTCHNGCWKPALTRRLKGTNTFACSVLHTRDTLEWICRVSGNELHILKNGMLWVAEPGQKWRSLDTRLSGRSDLDTIIPNLQFQDADWFDACSVIEDQLKLREPDALPLFRKSGAAVLDDKPEAHPSVTVHARWISVRECLEFLMNYADLTGRFVDGRLVLERLGP